MFVPGATAVLLASTHVYLHQYVVCSRLISTGDDVVTETDHRLYGGAGAPGWGSRRTRGRSAENSFRCIGRRRFGSRRRQRSEFGWIFGHCEPAGCDVQVRLVSRSCRSFRALRHADHQPRCRTCHVGPRLRSLYASVSALRPWLISSSFWYVSLWVLDDATRHLQPPQGTIRLVSDSCSQRSPLRSRWQPTSRSTSGTERPTSTPHGLSGPSRGLGNRRGTVCPSR